MAIPSVSTSPNDERVEIDLDLDYSEVEMPVSTQEMTELNIQGWVDMTKKPPGELLTVDLSVTTQGQYVISAGAYPDILYFFYTGRQFFNLTLRLGEDTAPGKEYLVDVFAETESAIGFDNDIFHLKVTTVPDLGGTSLLIEPPKQVRPGGTTEGVVRVTNTGTRYAEYRLSIRDDKRHVVENLRFLMEVEMTPNWVEDAPFRFEVSKDAQPGKHHVELNLLVVQDSGATTIVDDFEFDVEVEAEEEEFNWSSLMVPVLAISTLAVVIGLVVRRMRNR
jgi:hypothetical protein